MILALIIAIAFDVVGLYLAWCLHANHRDALTYSRHPCHHVPAPQTTYYVDKHELVRWVEIQQSAKSRDIKFLDQNGEQQ